jgi:uncharacterized protein YkwD
MRKLVFILAAVWTVLFGLPLAQGEGPADETRITLRDEFLRIINRDRAQFGLSPVALDPATSLLADGYCRQQIRNGTTGHFTTDGVPPYMRYSLAGGNDGISENAAAWSANYAISDRSLYDMIRSSERAMMREMPPHDGHRRTILDPWATHVGIGLAWNGGEFRMTQEFIRRYVDWQRPLPRAAAVGDHVLAAGRPLKDYKVDAITVHHESLPQPITATVANAINSYSLPTHRRDYLPRLPTYHERHEDGALYEVREQYADGRRGDFAVTKDGAFSFAVPLVEGPGVYTVVVWVRHTGESTPIAASNVSIRVEDRSANVAFSAASR